MERDELRVVSGYRSDPENEERWGFVEAHDSESDDTYAYAIVAQVELRGALLAACADVASTVGAQDYDESVLAVHAVGRQWERVADALDSWDPYAVRVRMAAGQLQLELAREDFDPEMLADVVSMCALEDEMRNHAAAVAMAEDDDAAEVEAYLDQHAERIELAFGMLAHMKADLRRRGELGLDDELLPDHEMDDDED